MWKVIKAIIVSWLIGVMCGVGLVILAQRHDQTPVETKSDAQPAPQTSGAAPASPTETIR
jgi:hypothetical protein